MAKLIAKSHDQPKSACGFHSNLDIVSGGGFAEGTEVAHILDTIYKTCGFSLAQRKTGWACWLEPPDEHLWLQSNAKAPSSTRPGCPTAEYNPQARRSITHSFDAAGLSHRRDAEEEERKEGKIVM